MPNGTRKDASLMLSGRRGVCSRASKNRSIGIGLSNQHRSLTEAITPLLPFGEGGSGSDEGIDDGWPSKTIVSLARFSIKPAHVLRAERDDSVTPVVTVTARVVLETLLGSDGDETLKRRAQWTRGAKICWPTTNESACRCLVMVQFSSVAHSERQG